MQRTNIYLDDRQVGLLDQLAADEGVSRAELIRRFLDRALDGSADTLDHDLAAIDATFGRLAGADTDLADVTRVPDERDAHLARMWRLPA